MLCWLGGAHLNPFPEGWPELPCRPSRACEAAAGLHLWRPCRGGGQRLPWAVGWLGCPSGQVCFWLGQQTVIRPPAALFTWQYSREANAFAEDCEEAERLGAVDNSLRCSCFFFFFFWRVRSGLQGPFCLTWVSVKPCLPAALSPGPWPAPGLGAGSAKLARPFLFILQRGNRPGRASVDATRRFCGLLLRS